MIELAALAILSFCNVQPAADISMRDRAFITAKIYSAVDSYFGHLSAVPEFKLEDEFPKLLDKAFAAKGRLEFDLACLEFFGRLKNGHTNFYDPWLFTSNGESMGFTAAFVEDKWIVKSSRVPELKVGDVIKQIDGKPFEEFYESERKYLCASSDRDCRNRFTSSRFLFPREFTLQKDDGMSVRIKSIPYEARIPKKTRGQWLETNRIGYIKVPAFDNATFENDALNLLKEFRSAQSLIIDVRQNGGGNTPSKLINSLMDRPFRMASYTTPQTIAVFRVWGGYADSVEKDSALSKDEDYGAATVQRSLGYGYYYSPPPVVANQPTGFKGRLFILIDRGVFSAGEDFCIPFKDNRRATFIGEATGGSTGQPYWVQCPNGISFRVSTKRDCFPDGSGFEGLGVKPDIEIPLTSTATRNGTDDVLTKAVELAKNGK